MVTHGSVSLAGKMRRLNPAGRAEKKRSLPPRIRNRKRFLKMLARKKEAKK